MTPSSLMRLSMEPANQRGREMLPPEMLPLDRQLWGPPGGQDQAEPTWQKRVSGIG